MTASRVFFSIAGPTFGLSDYLKIYRFGDMIVLDFVNNAFLPLKVVQFEDRYNLQLCGKDLFKSGVSEQTTLTVYLYTDSLHENIDARICTTSEECLATVRVYGSVVLSWGFNVSSFDSAEVIRFAWDNHVNRPIGFGVKFLDPIWYGSEEYGFIEACDSGAIMHFPEDAVVTVLFCSDGLRLCNSLISFEVDKIDHIFVRYIEVFEKCYIARISLLANKCITLENVVVTPEGFSYKGEFVSSTLNTKRQVLLWG